MPTRRRTHTRIVLLAAVAVLLLGSSTAAEHGQLVASAVFIAITAGVVVLAALARLTTGVARLLYRAARTAAHAIRRRRPS